MKKGIIFYFKEIHGLLYSDTVANRVLFRLVQPVSQVILNSKPVPENKVTRRNGLTGLHEFFGLLLWP